MEKILEYADKINQLKDNNYFKILKTKPSKELFIQSQEAFIYAVDNWSKILGQMVIKVPSDSDRLVIIENLYDEHGNGDISKSHVNTFRKLLISLGYKNELPVPCTQQKYESMITSECVEKFNRKLWDAIYHEDWVFAVTVLGMIEYTYITASKYIHQYVGNFIDKEEIEHYSIHEVLDVKHATELFGLITKYVDVDFKYIQDGLQYGYKIMDKLYHDMSEYLQKKN